MSSGFPVCVACPDADDNGYVRHGRLLNYTGGRSNGCTSWWPTDSEGVFEISEDKPTTLHIYPESGDIDAVAQAVKVGRAPSCAGLYWNASFLRAIGAPKFWPKEILGPIIAQYRKDHPPPAPRPLPLCKRR